MADILAPTSDVSIFDNDSSVYATVNASHELLTKDTTADNSLAGIKTQTDKLTFTGSNLNTNATVAAVSTGGDQPNAEVALNPGDTSPLLLDGSGNLQTRALILTDEGSISEPFAGTSLPAGWTSVVGTGGSVSVANSILTIASGTTANSETYVTFPIDYLPIRIDLIAQVSQRIANQDIYIGVSDTVNPATETQYARLRFNGTNNLAVLCETAAHTGTGGQESDASVLNNSSALYQSYNISLLQELVSFEAGLTRIEREVLQADETQIPSPYTPLFIRFRIKNGAVAPASSTALKIDTVRVLNMNRVDIAQKDTQDSAVVSIVGYDTYSQVNRRVNVDTAGRLLISQENPASQLMTFRYEAVVNFAGALVGQWWEAIEYIVPAGYKYNITNVMFSSLDTKMTGRLSKYIRGGTWNIATNAFTPTGFSYPAPYFADYLELELDTTVGNADVTVTVTYTNQDGVAGKHATAVVPKNTVAGFKIPMTLETGDTGVRAISAVSDNSNVAGTLTLNMGVTIYQQTCTIVNETYRILPPKDIVVYPGELVVADITVNGSSNVNRMINITGKMEKL
jgi:hypothetical protein